MSADLLNSVWNLWGALWRAFGQSSPAAYFITIAGVSTPALGAVRLYVHRRLKTQAWEIHLLTKNLEETKVARGNQEAKKNEAEARTRAAESRLPEMGLKQAQQIQADQDSEHANRALAAWCQREGLTISGIMFHRARWSAAAAGLVAAESYAISAVSFWPGNREAENLLNDIERTMQEEAQPWPTSKKALAEFDEYAFQPFDRGLDEEASSLEVEAARQREKGSYHVALPLIERAVHLRIQTIGKSAPQTHRAQLLKARVLTNLGRYSDGLPIAQACAEAASATLGPEHPDSLSARLLVAHILDNLGQYEEALLMAQAEAETASSALGSEHPQTLAALYLVASILDDLGRFQEALPIAQAGSEAARATLGPEHPDRLSGLLLVARILNNLGQYEEALPVARAVAEGASSALGSEDPRTLAAPYLVASILDNLGRFEEALPTALAVAKPKRPIRR